MISHKMYIKKQDVILLNSYSYSSVTAGHKAILSSTIPPNYIRFYVPDCKFTIVANQLYYFGLIEENLKKACRARTKRDSYLAKAMEYKDIIIRYRSIFGKSYRLSKTQKQLLSTTYISSIDLSKLKQQEQAARARARARLLKQKFKEIKRERLSLARWLSNDIKYITLRYNDKVYLRINKDQIETSKYASMDMKRAKTLYYIMQHHKICREYDGYRMSYNNNNLVIGCHTIDRLEIDRIAKLAGWGGVVYE